MNDKAWQTNIRKGDHAETAQRMDGPVIDQFRENMVEARAQGRRGRFRVAMDLLYNDPGLVLAIQRDVLIGHIDSNWTAQFVEFHGHSPLWKAIGEGTVSTEYVPQITEAEDGSISWEWVAIG